MKLTRERLKEIIEEEIQSLTERCWDGYERVPGKRAGEPGSCRKKGSVKEDKDKEGLEPKIRKILKDEGGAAGLDAIVKGTDASEDEVKAALKAMVDVGLHENGDYILDDESEIDVKKKLNDPPLLDTLEEKKKKKQQKGKKRARKTAKRKKKKKKAAKRDACYHKVKARYDVWPSAYASGALVKCRKVGAANWGEGGKKNEAKKKKAGSESSKESSLRDWFGRKGEKGSKGGWVDCNAPDGKGGYKACGRSGGEKRKRYPSCRPTPAACKEKGRGKSWGKKGAKKEGIKMERQRLMEIIKEEIEEAAYYEYLAEGETLEEAEYQGRKVTLNKPMKGDVKKSKVYVRDPKTGNVKKVNFGDPKMKIRKSNPEARKSFRARHNCAEKMKKGDKTTAGYWSCKAW